jgi:hypothetical protein
MGENMSNEQVRRACVRALMNHLAGREDERPVALGCKLVRSSLTAEDVATIWARLADELREQDVPGLSILPDDWGPLREMLVEYRAVVRESLHSERQRLKSRSMPPRVAERRACE